MQICALDFCKRHRYFDNVHILTSVRQGKFYCRPHEKQVKEPSYQITICQNIHIKVQYPWLNMFIPSHQAKCHLMCGLLTMALFCWSNLRALWKERYIKIINGNVLENKKQQQLTSLARFSYSSIRPSFSRLTSSTLQIRFDAVSA